jgi:hypothetical protein
MKLLHTLGEEAAGPGGVSRASFVAGALRELSVGLVRGNYFLYRASVGMLARSGGTCFRPGLTRPTDDCCAEYCACRLFALAVGAGWCCVFSFVPS